MKKLLVFLFVLYSFSIHSQEGTKQLMPNEGDRLWLEINCVGKDFATYNAPDKSRLYVYMNSGETMYFGMKIADYSWWDIEYYNTAYFRIRNEAGTVIYSESAIPTSADPGYISTYGQAVNGPNGAIINNTEITSGYSPLSFTAPSSGNYYIEFISRDYYGNRDDGDRFALEFFDVTVTQNDTVITNPGEPNKSAGRLWSKGWALTNTSFVEYRAKVHFYVFTSDEFVNKIQYQMKPYSFDFVSNSFGVENSSSLNVIEKAQSQEGNQTGSSDISEYKIYLNDPDRNVWKTTALPPPEVKVWYKDNLIYDYDYMSEPQESDIELDTLIFEKNRPGCEHSSIVLFKIQTNVSGFTTIFLDIDGNGYSTAGTDRVLHRKLKKGRNYILWNFRNDNGEIVSNGPISVSATFYGRGATHFPLYDVETLSGVATKTKRPFNKLCPTLYWDDSQITDWGDGPMDETEQTQLTYGETNIPRIWAFNQDKEWQEHNGNMNTMNSWYNAIDLGRANMEAEIVTSDTLCVNGNRPMVADVFVDTSKNENIVFTSKDFTSKFSDPLGNPLTEIQVLTTPDTGSLELNGTPVSPGDIISESQLSDLTFDPVLDWTGETIFLWNGSNGTYYAEESDTVHLFINTPPEISPIGDTSICTGNNVSIDFIVDDADDIHNPEDIDVIAYSNNLNVVPNSGIEVTGSGSLRTLTVEPYGIQSGYTIIYLQAYDGVTSSIQQFAINMSPSLEIIGDTSVCVGSQLELTAVEVGADSYIWEHEGTQVGTERTYTDSELYKYETGTYTLTITKGSCTSSRDFTVSIYPVVSFSGDTDLCVGETLQLTADETIADAYEWRKGSNLLSEEQTLEIPDVDLTDDGNDYTLYVNKEGCENTSDPFTVSVIENTDTTLTITGSTVNLGENGIVTIEGSDNGILYNAFVRGSLVATGYGTGSDLEITIPSDDLMIGDNIVTVEADNGNCIVDMSQEANVHVNVLPVAVDDNANTEEDTDITVNVLENDSGLEDGGINISLSSGPYNGTVTNIGDSTITYSPNLDYFGEDSLVYEVCDVDNDCDSAYVHFNITPIDDNPTANDDNVTTDEDQPVTIDVLDNDTGLDAGLVVSVTSDPGNGNTEVHDDNSVTYTPSADYNGSDAFTYRVTDEDGDYDEADVNITVNPVDDQPVANDDDITTDEDTEVTANVLENDEGLGDGVQNVTVTTDASNGTTTVNPDSTITYTPAPDYNGEDSFVYEVEDTDGDTDYATVNITINPVNDQPVANDTTVTTNEDTEITIDVLANDQGLGDGGLDVIIDSDPGNGTATVNLDNTVTYSPEADYNGTDNFTYVVTDADGDTDNATVTVNVDPVNDQPVANDDDITTDEDTEVTANVLENDEGLGDGGLTLSIETNATNGTATVVGDSTVTYVPDPNYYGSDNFSYKICDGDDECDIATVSVSINSVDDIPEANNDIVSTDEDTEININVLDNDTGLGDGGIGVTIATEANHGSLQVNTDNSITYIPDDDYNGEDDFTYEVCDGDGDCNMAIVQITVNPVNDIPVANDDSSTTNENTEVTLDVLANDEGLGDGDLVVTIADNPSYGTANVNTNNTITYDPNTDNLNPDSFTYSLCDENGNGECDTATVSITIDNVDDTPVANDDNVIIDEDTDTTIAVLANDEDLNDGGISVTLIVEPDNGQAIVNSDNTVDYSPNANYYGSDFFEYVVCDVDDDCDTATVYITINEVNDVPVANDDETSTEEDTEVTVDVLQNDEGLGDGGISVNIVDPPSNGNATENGNNITYQPAPDYYGSDNFTYEVCDGDGDCDIATVTINVTSVNDVPVANSDNLTLDEDTQDTVNILDNDTGLGDGGIGVTVEDEPDHGNYEITADNRIVYIPDPNYYGSDTLIYEVCDRNDECDTSRVFINVTSVNDLPVANDDNLTLDEDTRDTVNVLENDTGLGDGGIEITVETEPTHGDYEITNDNRIVYIPETNYNGPDELAYKVCDENGNGECDVAIVDITVAPVNDIPDAVDDEDTIDEDTQSIINVVANDNGLGDGLSNLEIEDSPVNGEAIVIGDSTIQYTPDANYYGQDQYDYRVTDTDGDSDIATVTITVESVNDIPDAADDEDTIDEDTQSIINVLANDNGLSDGLSNLEIENPPANGEATIVGDSTIQYIPDKDYNGQDQFDYRVTDTNGDYDIATVTINIEPVNDAPVAVNDTIETNEDVDVTYNVLENDNGLGDGGLSISITQTPENGNAEVAGDSTITYSPNPYYYGEDSLVYEVSDADNETSTARVYITVHPIDDHRPDANDDERGTEMNTPVDVDVLFNDTGLEDGGIFLQIDDAYKPEHGNAVVTANNTINYTPGTDYLGDDEFVYQVYDYDNDVSSARVTIHVVENNNVPIANDDNVSTHRNTQLFIDVLNNDTNLDDGGIEVAEWISPEHGMIESIDSNYVKYVPNNNYVGDDRFVYKVNDAEGDFDTASVYITVTDDENILPVANLDSVSTPEDTEVTHDVLSNDDNLDDGVYTLTITEAPENGVVTGIEINGVQGNITYNPNADYYGLDSLVYQVCDLNNDCDEAKVIIEIEAVDDYQPVAFDDSSGTSRNTPVGVNVLMNDNGLGDGGIVLSEYNAPDHGDITDIIDNEIIEYTPETNYLGYDNFKYQISDNDGDTDHANVKITVRENNLVPVANADTAETPKETPIEIDVLANDIPGDEGMADMKVTEFIEPENGSIFINEDPLITYTPDIGFNAGIDTFYYKVDDVDGDWDTASVSVIVYDGYNHRPHAFDDYEILDEDTPPVFIDVLKNDTALQDEPIQLSIKTQPLHGEITQMYGDSAIAYRPDPDYFGEDSLTYEIRDINGDSDEARVYLQIRPVDDGFPIAKDDSTGTSMNTPVDVAVLMNDENLKDSIVLSKVSDPAHGSIQINEDSTITYTPDTDYLGRDEFEYRITDYDNQSDEAKVIIEVRKNNIEPIALADSAYTIMNQKVNINVLRNDSLLDDGVGQVSIFEIPSHGRTLVRPDNTVRYTPAEDYTGTDEFIYKIDDIDGDWDTAFVKVTIDTIPNYIPEANDDFRATNMNESVDVDVLINDTGLEDGPVNVWIIDNPGNGTAAVNQSTNIVTYQPDDNYLGKDTLQYAVFDADEDSDTARLIINVKEDNLVPVAVDDSAQTLMNHEVEIHVLNNDSLLQDGIGGISIFSEAVNGELAITPYNTVIYKPYQWYTGADEFEYLVEDVDGDFDIATVSVTIKEIPNYQPEARDDSTGTSMNEAVTIDVLRNDVGLNDTPLTLTNNSNPDNGIISINADKTITYSPDKDFLGYDYFEYKVTDYDDECDSAIVKIHVRENNTVPVAVNDKVYTKMNTSVTVDVLGNDEGLDDGMGALTIAHEPVYGEVAINKDFTLTYTPHNWFVGQDTLIYELTDIDGDYDTAHLAIGVLDIPGPLPEVEVSEVDDSTSENKTTAHFNMVLKTAPTADVIIQFSSSDLTEGTLAESQVTFTPLNWDRQKGVTITGVDDDIKDGDVEYKILTANAISSDPVYSDLTVSNVDVVNKDNDETGIEVILHDNNTTSEKGDQSKFGLVLSSQPYADVLIDIESSDRTEGVVNTSQVVFDTSNWNTEKEIIVTGVNDNEIDGDIEYQVDFTTSSEDTLYDGVPIESIFLVNLDNNEIESFVPEAFSPNNDGYNDQFTILGLEEYDDLSLKIYNRWGTLVYSNNDYQNDWDGRANVSTLGGNKLPTGSYYYYLKIKDTGETIEGSVFLKR